MKKHIYIVPLLALGMSLNSCDDLFEPAPENTQSLEQYNGAPTGAHGILLTSYTQLNAANKLESDLATDDIVERDLQANWRKIATGAWTADNNPVSHWSQYYYAIQNLNLFMENLPNVKWYQKADWQAVQQDHFFGEAYGLRAIFMYYLLQAHAGNVDGKLTGVLIHNASEDGSSDFNQSRASFKECYDAAMKDFDEAILRLPDEYIYNWKESQISQRLKDLGATPEIMNRVNGYTFCIRKLNGKICRAYRAKLALMSASPAYGQESYENAANFAKEVVNLMGGIDKISEKDIDWFSDDKFIESLKNDESPSFALWWEGVGDANFDDEKAYFPPSISGTGNVNPTQNLVDAFPMANGYPISDAKSGYDQNNPYANRDPRLEKYILFNEGSIDTKVITTATYADNNDGLNKDASVSTRTGYYMKKFLAPKANPSSTGQNKQKHVNVRLRTLEMFLVYAEAANEAWGPTSGSPSAYDVIKKIRSVSGITGGDAYLESIKGDKDKMRQLIRNERRINLCFENKRFWDLRRWKLDLNETAKGMKISGSKSSPVYEVINVDKRNYQDYMYYGPLPASDVNKFSNLQQNDGWQ